MKVIYMYRVSLVKRQVFPFQNYHKNLALSYRTDLDFCNVLEGDLIIEEFCKTGLDRAERGNPVL